MPEDSQHQHAAAIRVEREVMQNLGVTRSQARDVLHGFAAETANRKAKEAELEKTKPPRIEGALTFSEQKIGDAKGAVSSSTTTKQPGGAGSAGGAPLHQFIFNSNGIDEYWSVPALFDGTV